MAQYQIHISADIAFALQQFYATINDRDWLCANAWPLLEKIATFLVSRVEVDTVTGDYHIKGKKEMLSKSFFASMYEFYIYRCYGS